MRELDSCDGDTSGESSTLVVGTLVGEGEPGCTVWKEEPDGGDGGGVGEARSAE